MLQLWYGTGKHSQRSDVYAFGVVLLELLTGQQPVDPSRRDAPGLVQHMLPRLGSIDSTQAHLDPVLLRESISAPQLAMFTEVAAACLQDQPQDRWETRGRMSLRYSGHAQMQLQGCIRCRLVSLCAACYEAVPVLSMLTMKLK